MGLAIEETPGGANAASAVSRTEDQADDAGKLARDSRREAKDVGGEVGDTAKGAGAKDDNVDE